MTIKLVDIEYLRAQKASAGQLILAGLNNNVTYTQFVTVDINGNVGIGTTTPVSTLQVNGNILLQGLGSSIKFTDSTSISTASDFYSAGLPGTIQFAGLDNKFSGDSNRFVWDTTNYRIGIGTSTPVSTLQVNYTAIESTSTTINTTDPTVLDSFSILKVRSAQYFVQVTDVANSQFHVSQLTVVHNGLSAFKTEYGIVTTDEKLGNFDAVISSGNLQLIFTAFVGNSKTVKITRTSMTA